MEEQVRTQLRDFIVANFLFGDVSRAPDESVSLLDTGIIDSTGVLELVDLLETDLGVVVADDETIPENLDSIDNLVRFVVRKRSDSAA
jgi:acyl carrier protein